MLDREAVSARLEAGGISYTEFSYQILQSLDFLELYRRHGCVLQTGGSDQWGNITAGVDLIRRVTAGEPHGLAHALSTTLLTKADGTKFGKTDDGAVWLDPELTCPYAFYQYFLNVDDADVPSLLRYFTFRSRDEIEDLEAQVAAQPAARAAQRVLAEDLTTLVHGAVELEAAQQASRALFGQGDLAALPPGALEAALREAGLRRRRPGGHDRGPARGDRPGGEQGRRPAHGGRGRGVPQQRPRRGPRRGAGRASRGSAGGSSCCAGAARPSRAWSTAPERGPQRRRATR